MKIINEICTYLADGWVIDIQPKQKLVDGYIHLVSGNEKNKNFSMYCYLMNEKLYINGCVFDELNGAIYNISLNKGALQMAKLIRKNVISQKDYLFSIINSRR